MVGGDKSGTEVEIRQWHDRLILYCTDEITINYSGMVFTVLSVLSLSLAESDVIKAKYQTLLLDCQSLDKIISDLPKLLSGYGLTITA